MNLLYKILFLIAVLVPGTGSAQILWQEQSTGVNDELLDISFVDKDTGYSCGVGGVILATTNGGNTWLPQNSGTTDDITGVQFHDGNTGWVVGYNGRIMKTINGGSTWTTQILDVDVDFEDVFFLDDLSGWACGHNPVTGYGIVYKTTDGGSNWLLTSGTTIPGVIWSIDFIGAPFGFCVTDDDGFYTSDGGTTWWSMTSIPGTVELNYINMFNSMQGWISGDGGTIYKTTTGGTSWTVQPSGVTDDLWAIAVVDINTIFIAADGGVLKTTNGGGSWQSQSGPFGNYLLAMTAIDANTAWTAGGMLFSAGTIYHGALPNTDLEIIDYLGDTIGCKDGDFEVIVKVENGGNLDASAATFKVIDGITTVIDYDWSGNIAANGGLEVISLGTISVSQGSVLSIIILGDTISGNNTWFQPVGVANDGLSGVNGPHYVCSGDPLDLFVYGGSEYYWLNATPDSTQQTQHIIATQSENYVVEITQAGCVTTDTVVVSVTGDCVTNAFSPNDDGLNDLFVIDGIDPVSNTVTIYNRWGDEIRVFTNYDNVLVAWNGVDASGQKMTAGSYYYIVESASRSFAGFVQLVD